MTTGCAGEGGEPGTEAMVHIQWMYVQVVSTHTVFTVKASSGCYTYHQPTPGPFFHSPLVRVHPHTYTVTSLTGSFYFTPETHTRHTHHEYTHQTHTPRVHSGQCIRMEGKPVNVTCSDMASGTE